MFKILFSPKKAERHPLEMMLIAIFYSSISILFAMWIFPEQVSLVMVFFTVFSIIYVIQGAFRGEEIKNRKGFREEKLLKHHLRILVFMIFLFMGFVISFSVWAFVLSNEKSSHIFFMQNSAVQNIRSVLDSSEFLNESSESISGGFVSIRGITPILINNFKVLFVSLIFAIFFGAGAIFILVWNASVMGYVIGNLARESLGIIAMPIAFLKYFVHGVPEMLAYFIAALGGGIIYIAVWNGDFLNQEKNRRIIKDVFVLILISIFLLIIAAFLEIYVSPLF